MARARSSGSGIQARAEAGWDHGQGAALLPAAELQFDGSGMGQGAARRVVGPHEYLEQLHARCVTAGCRSPADQARELPRLLSGPAAAYIRHPGLRPWAGVARPRDALLYRAACRPARPSGASLASLRHSVARAWHSYEHSGGALSHEHKYHILAGLLLPPEACAFRADPAVAWPAVTARVSPTESAEQRALRFGKMLAALEAFCDRLPAPDGSPASPPSAPRLASPAP
jgi:hypothetical protein